MHKDYDNSKFYFNRELSWLEFNSRVLEEAQDRKNLIFERLKFLAITASNLDEFFMVRVSGLIDKNHEGIIENDVAGLNPAEQLDKISEKVHDFTNKQYNTLNRSILPALEKENTFILTYKQLSGKQQNFVKKYFESTVFPVLTPMAVDKSRPFPLLMNKSLNIIVELENKEDSIFAVVKVPTVIPRVLELPCGDSKRKFIFMENVIKEFIDQLFIDKKVSNSYTFRITRDAEFNIGEENANDLLQEIEESIKKRERGAPVRLEVEKNISKNSLKFLKKRLNLEEEKIYQILGPIDLTVFFAFTSLDGYEHLKNNPLASQPVIEFENIGVFDAIKKKDILVHHPYDSFECVTNFVKTSANDPNVLAIKQTLYRVSGKSPIVSALIQAAENGKQVTVLVELQARFDEENNILWAKKLEKAGCHVVYGLSGLKTHCKICLVVRKESDGIHRYLHLGTGNYNDSTAKVYTDMGYFTCKESFGKDVSTLFNVLTGYSHFKNFQKLAVAPRSLKETFLHHIEKEISNAMAGKEASIIAKMNSLVDKDIIKALYRASSVGVQIKLIVRGICCLKSGIQGVSENIIVASIVDRFLEHSRIYYFENRGNPTIFLSSADLMPRNLERRIEVAFPIEDQDLKQEVIEILDITLSDTVKLRVQQLDGTYEKVDRRGKEAVRSQLFFHERACKKTESYNLSLIKKENPLL